MQAGAERPLVLTDVPSGPDELGRADDAAFLAEVVRHRGLEAPFCLGLFGAPGSGKTFFLNEIAAALEAAAGGAEPNGSAAEGVAVVRVDAARPGEPEALLAEAVLDRLAESHPALAAELAHAGADPGKVARGANETLNDLRRRHQAEKEALDGLGGREARLADSVLETAGSSLDAYARRHRPSIERALRQFGFENADNLATFKALAREAAESPGLPARLGFGARALWAYRGQTRLIILGALLACLAWFLAGATSGAGGWTASLRGMGDRAAPIAAWVEAHGSSLAFAQTVAVLLCLFCLALAGWRAIRFIRPVFEGAGLLRRDIAVRSRDLQILLAHQTRQVDALAAEVEAAARHAAEADRRAAVPPAGRQGQPRGLGRIRPTPARAMFEALGAVMASAVAMSAAPGRIVLLVDNLDARSSEGAAALVDTARQVLGPGFVCVVSGDRGHLAEGFGDTDPARALARFERCIQVGYRIDANAAPAPAWSGYAARLIGGPASRPLPAPRGPDPRPSGLDRPWRHREAEILSALSPYAGDTPRAIKRYVNLYRIARADPRLRDAPDPAFTGLAIALALDARGFPEDLAPLGRPGPGEEASAGGSSLLTRALATARDACGAPVDFASAQRGIEIAGRYAGRV